MILNRIEDQNAVIGLLRADAPFLKQVNGIALNVAAVECIDRDERDLGLRFFVNLAAHILDLGFGFRVENMSKVVDVSGGLKLSDRFCLGGNAGDQQQDGQANSCADTHRQIVQEGSASSL